jgi:hypothetical protein
MSPLFLSLPTAEDMKKGFIIVTAVSLAVIAGSGFSMHSSLHILSQRSTPERLGIRTASPDTAATDTLSTVRVAVYNGCGRPGIASAFVEKLRRDGMDVVNGWGGNADSFEFDRSVVVDRRGDLKKAERVSASLGIKEILAQRSESPYLLEDVVVVIGRDWDALLFPKKEKTY